MRRRASRVKKRRSSSLTWDLRHTHAALYIARVEHPKVIADPPLGHTSFRTVLEVYGCLYEGMDEAAAQRLDAQIMFTTPAPGAGDRAQLRRRETLWPRGRSCVEWKPTEEDVPSPESA